MMPRIFALFYDSFQKKIEEEEEEGKENPLHMDIAKSNYSSIQFRYSNLSNINIVNMTNEKKKCQSSGCVFRNISIKLFLFESNFFFVRLSLISHTIFSRDIGLVFVFRMLLRAFMP